MDDSDDFSKEFVEEHVEDYYKKFDPDNPKGNHVNEEKMQNPTKNTKYTVTNIVGKTFKSDQEIKDFIARFEKDTSSIYKILGGSKEKEKNNMQRYEANPNITKRSITYNCQKGRQNQSISTGERSSRYDSFTIVGPFFVDI